MTKERFNEIKSMIKLKVNQLQGGLCQHLERIQFVENKISFSEYAEFRGIMNFELDKITDKYFLTGEKSNSVYARYKFPNNEERIKFLDNLKYE